MALFHPGVVVVDGFLQGMADPVLGVDPEPQTVEPLQAIPMAIGPVRLADVA